MHIKTVELKLSGMCRALQVSRSGYYDWLQRCHTPTQRAIANVILLKHIQAVHQQFRQAYGALKTWKHLNNIGIACGKHRVATLRKEAGIEAILESP